MCQSNKNIRRPLSNFEFDMSFHKFIPQAGDLGSGGQGVNQRPHKQKKAVDNAAKTTFVDSESSFKEGGSRRMEEVVAFPESNGYGNRPDRAESECRVADVVAVVIVHGEKLIPARARACDATEQRIAAFMTKVYSMNSGASLPPLQPTPS